MPELPPDLIPEHFAHADVASTSHEKGRILEDLISALFRLVPGVSVARRNIVSPYGTEELDVLLWNQALPDGLFFLDSMIAVECKNWHQPVDGQVISYFVERIAQVGLHDGVLISSAGITGTSDPPTRARHHISAALPRGIRILVVSRPELEALTAVE